jgi:uncharacterized protein YndB with AHSA1/START domain
MNVQRSVEVACGPDEAFEHFTAGINEWWPLRAGFSFGGERCDAIFLEAHTGGRFYERFVDGDELPVGTVTVCDRPHRLVFTWEPPVWPGATEVEVRFTDNGDDTTTVHVDHRGFEALGETGAATRDSFDSGWPTVLEAYAAYVRSAP